MPEIHAMVNVLKRDRSFGFTYNGTITRSDGADISVDEVTVLLETLRLFLSFARGGYCSLALVEGKDEHGAQSWVRWGSHDVSELGNGHSWLMRVGGDDILTGLFPKFCDLLGSKNGWRDTIARTIDWYLRSNESPPYVGLLLTQAALERLSCQILGGERPRKFIEKALKKLPGLGDSIPVPSSCQELLGLGKWQSAPHALVDLRNDLVHPEETLTGVSDLVYHEAWNLGQWYIEMMLLNLLGYQGSYRNRLGSWRQGASPIPEVPWLTHS